MQMLIMLRRFIYMKTDLKWGQLREAVGDIIYAPNHTLLSNAAWATPKSPAWQRLKGQRGGVHAVEKRMVVGGGSRQFCEAVKVELEIGRLQLLADGTMQFAIDPVTGYHYSHQEPLLPGMVLEVVPSNRLPPLPRLPALQAIEIVRPSS